MNCKMKILAHHQYTYVGYASAPHPHRLAYQPIIVPPCMIVADGRGTNDDLHEKNMALWSWHPDRTTHRKKNSLHRALVERNIIAL